MDWFIIVAQLFGNSPCRLTYNIIVGSLGETLCEAFIIISTIVFFITYMALTVLKRRKTNEGKFNQSKRNN